MPAAFRIAGKDLRLRVRDRSVAIIGVLAPLTLAFIFNLIFGGAVASGGLSLEYGVVDLDASEVSEAFTAVLEDLDEEEVLSLRTFGDTQTAETSLSDSEIDAFYVIPTGFGADVAMGSPEIGVVGDIDAPTATQIAASIADQFATGIETTRLAILTTAQLSGVLPTPEFVDSLDDPSASAFSYSLSDLSADTRLLDATTYYAAGMAIFFVFFTVQFGVVGLLEEERDGTLPRLFAAPISRWSVVMGKALLSLALGVFSLGVLVVATTLIMSADWGPALGVALLVVAAVAAGTGLMGLVAAVARTPEGAQNLGSIIAVTLGLLGGVFFPLGQGDDLVSRLTYATPHAWFLRGLGDIAGGGSWTGALPSAAALAVFALVAGTIGWAAMRRRLSR
ncbi:MAG: ABC transporter permease [Actinobacteria bacterium]|nr:ABC transporter permease [Actinomycetota bacterium]